MNGIINLKKEAGMTSHDVVFKLRKILGTKKIGHGGTLDPDVVGVLPIAVGKATRMVEFMQDEGKVYEGEITLGYSTTTEDSSGEVVAETPVLSPLDEKLVDEAIASLTGPITQIPPMYSAVKVNGRKLYEYARAGQEVERPERQVIIYSFERTSPISYEDKLARFTFRVKCSKGTYIRTLLVDLGEKLGYSAHMSHLTRTSAAGLQLEDSLTLALDLLTLPLSLLDVLALLDEVTWLLFGILSAELDSLWLEQAVSKATEERVTMESTIA